MSFRINNIFFVWFSIWIVIAIGSCVLGVYLGSVPLSFSQLLSLEYKQILWEIRMPRTLLAFLVGASLSISGGGFQGVLRNTLAEPYLLGVSSGCALGAIIPILLGYHNILGIWSLPIFAFLGGMASLCLVFWLATKKQCSSSDWILLGVILNALLGAIISIILIIYQEQQSEILYWLMGSLSLKTWSSVWLIFPYFLISIIFLLRWAPSLNILSLGEREAWHTGVPVTVMQWKVLGVSSVLAAACVSISGIVGFVGLVVPHLVRLMVGPGYRKVFLLSCLVGGVLLIWSDILARTILTPEELPLGGVTAFIGCPFFLLLFMRRKKK